MKKIVLLRHGESAWNLENRFTGWTDVPLTENGLRQADRAGNLLIEKGFFFDKAFVSYLRRAVKTLDAVLERMGQEWLPVQKDWRLNEKHYGMLQGLNKRETAQKYGDDQVLLWRRSYDVAPPPLPEDDPRNPRLDPRYRHVPKEKLPLTESLKDAVERVMPYWNGVVFPELDRADQLLVVAHGNTLRGVIQFLKGMSREELLKFNLPTGIPYVFEFDDQTRACVNDYFLGDPAEIKALMEQVANQGKSA